MLGWWAHRSRMELFLSLQGPCWRGRHTGHPLHLPLYREVRLWVHPIWGPIGVQTEISSSLHPDTEWGNVCSLQLRVHPQTILATFEWEGCSAVFIIFSPSFLSHPKFPTQVLAEELYFFSSASTTQCLGGISISSPQYLRWTKDASLFVTFFDVFKEAPSDRTLLKTLFPQPLPPQTLKTQSFFASTFLLGSTTSNERHSS